jgi:hypothetical protein
MVDSDRDRDRDRQIETTLNYTYFFRRRAALEHSLTFLKFQVNAPGSSDPRATGRFTSSARRQFPQPGFPGLDDDQNKALVTQLRVF